MRITNKHLVVAVAGVLVGALLTTALRFAFYKSDTVHYHANFALYVNGVQDKFDGPGFYEEVQACGSDQVDNPKTRVHLHNENPTLVHVHAHGVTWGQLFSNLGYGVSDKAVTTLNGVFVDGQDDKKLTFTLGGVAVDSIADKLIKSEDVLLVDYGQDDATTTQQYYEAIPRDAHQANTQNDPATCSGSKPLTFTERLKKAAGF